MMKKLLFINIILATLSTPAVAAPVDVKAIADDVLATYGDFSQTPGGSALSTGEITTIISSDPATAIYGFSATDYSVIDLGFGSDTAMTGQGADLVVFSSWKGYDYSFGLQAYDDSSTPNLLSSWAYQVSDLSYMHECTATDSAGGCIDGIVATSINLYNSSLQQVADDITLGYLSLFIGGDTYNGTVGGTSAYSNFSLVGAYHTDVTAVPLPLPAVLFGSGLFLLSWVGRRKKS